MSPMQEILQSLSTSKAKFSFQHFNHHFMSQKVKDVYYRYFPLTDRYFCILNPLMSYQLDEILPLNAFPVVMLRDGAISLIDFFLKYPMPPEETKTYFLVHEKLAHLVPRHWRHLVYLYKFEFKQNPKKPKELLLSGLLNDEYFLKCSPRKIIDLCRPYGEIEKLKFLLFNRHPISYNPSREYRDYLNVIGELQQGLGIKKIEGVDIEYIESSVTLKETLYFDLQTYPIIVADNFVTYKVSQLSGNVLELPHQASHEVIFRLPINFNQTIHVLNPKWPAESSFDQILLASKLNVKPNKRNKKYWEELLGSIN